MNLVDGLVEVHKGTAGGWLKDTFATTTSPNKDETARWCLDQKRRKFDFAFVEVLRRHKVLRDDLYALLDKAMNDAWDADWRVEGRWKSYLSKARDIAHQVAHGE